FSYFNSVLTPRGAKATDPTKGYYSFDIGLWHIIALNSEVSTGGGSVQEQWLRADLVSHPVDCTLAYWHKPRFSSGTNHGNNTNMQALWQALYDNRADIVLNGHEHNYERFALQTPTGLADSVNGVREFVAGMGGKNLYPFGNPKPQSEVRNNTSFGVLKLILHPTNYNWEFVKDDANHTLLDSGSASCVGLNQSSGMKQLLTRYLANDQLYEFNHDGKVNALDFAASI
ncbi:MAG: hypothetical protein AAB874_08260, partial [Patescibacteria group bacterium]